jgi:hypothetical protein
MEASKRRLFRFLSEDEIEREERESREIERDREREYRYIDIDIYTQGRPRLHSDEKHKRLIQVYVNRNKRLIYETLKAILTREGKSFSSWVFDHAESYVRLHEPGNPQQRLDTLLKIGKAYHSPSKICGFKDCMRDAVGVAFYVPRNEEYGYCSIHAKDIKDHADLWKVLK